VIVLLRKDAPAESKAENRLKELLAVFKRAALQFI